MKTIEDVKALHGYAKFKQTLIDLKVTASIYASNDYIEGRASKPFIIVNTINPDILSEQVDHLMPELDVVDLNYAYDTPLGFIPLFCNESAIEDNYILVEEISYKHTLESLKELPGYSMLKDFLLYAKIHTSIYVEDAYFDDDVPMLLLITEDVDTAFAKLYEAIPELLTEGSESYLGLIPVFFPNCDNYEGFTFIEEVTYNAQCTT